jgi:hypothetical protein
MGLEVGGVGHCCWVVHCGVLGLFLVIVGACHHPLTLPNLQVGACSSGNGWWVGIVMGFCLSGVWACQCDMACVWGCYVLTRQVAPFWGLPVSLCTLLACVNNLTSNLNRGGGGLGGCTSALHVFCCCRSSLLEYNLKIKRIQLLGPHSIPSAFLNIVVGPVSSLIGVGMAVISTEVVAVEEGGRQ